MDLGDWLRSLGLERYEAAFRKNEINDTVLLSFTVEDLKDLGVGLVGYRRKLLDGGHDGLPFGRRVEGSDCSLHVFCATDKIGQKSLINFRVTFVFS